MTLPEMSADVEMRDQLRLIFPFNFAKLIEAVDESVNGFLSRFKYHGPLRANPPRHLAFAEETGNTNAEGSFAWKAVRDNVELRAKVNEWFGKDFLQTRYEIGVDNLISRELMTDALETALEEVISAKYMEWDEARGRMGDPKADEFFYNPYDAWNSKMVLKKLLLDIFKRTAAGAVGELTLRDKRNQAYVSHRDIGIGVSQVLPVLVHAYASQQEIIAIEQPEIHLHPALQAELADVFIMSARGAQKNKFILETHSEHLILRVLRRIRETADGEAEESLKIRPEDVAVLYVKPGKDGSEIVELPINEEGDFDKPWPDGFFPERAKELF